MGLEDRIAARIVELEAIRDKFVEDANRQVVSMNGGIAELKALLSPESEEEAQETDSK